MAKTLLCSQAVQGASNFRMEIQTLKIVDAVYMQMQPCTRPCHGRACATAGHANITDHRLALSHSSSRLTSLHEAIKQQNTGSMLWWTHLWHCIPHAAFCTGCRRSVAFGGMYGKIDVWDLAIADIRGHGKPSASMSQTSGC